MKRIVLALALCLIAQVAGAEWMGSLWVDPSWVKLHEVGNMKIVTSVARQLTSAYRSNQRADLAMQTKKWDKTPSIMTDYTSDVLILDKPRRISLAGDQSGKKGWRVDNFLLIEVLDTADNVLSQKAVGRLDVGDSLSQKGKRVSQLQPNSTQFSAKQVDIGPLPVKKPFKLRVTAMDYGEFGEVTDVYMFIE